MAQAKPRAGTAQTLVDMQKLMQLLESNTPREGSVTIGDLLGPKVDRVRLFQDADSHRTMVRQVSLPKSRKGLIEELGKKGYKPKMRQELMAILERIVDPEISVDLTLDMASGSISLAVEMEPALEGQDLSALTGEAPKISTPVFDDIPFDDEYWSAEEAASNLGSAKSTITRHIKSNKLIGFKLFKNALYVPREQFDGKSMIKGVLEVLEMFDFDHRETWRFLSSSLFYGDATPRPIDRLRSMRPSDDLQACLSELKLAKHGFDYGDHT